MNKYIENINKSTLYIVPTPIGNLYDISIRTLSILEQVDIIAAENTFNTGLLLKYFSIKPNKIYKFNDHNEQLKTEKLIYYIKQGKSIALVSDNGTPLISDPGYYLIRKCKNYNIRIIPIPGPCAIITALSASGLPSNKFCYEGFLPSKKIERKKKIKLLSKESRTIIFFESTYRLIDSLKDMIIFFGPLRYIVLARELTKNWETIYGETLENLLNFVKNKNINKKGEITLVVEGYKKKKNKKINFKILKTLSLLMMELPLKTAVLLTSKIYGLKKNEIYKEALNKNYII